MPVGHYLLMPAANDMDLLREFARHHSEAAFTELVRRHLNLVYSVALRFTSNPGDAEDVTQAVFIILARKADRLSERTVLVGWLYETTRLTAAGFLRSQKRRQAHEQEAYMQSTVDQSGDNSVWRQLAPHLEAAMSRLAGRDRTLLALRFYENKTGAEAAKQLGIREEAAHKRTARALEKLRKFFTKRGIDSTTAVIAEQISANSVQAAPVALAKAVTAVAIAKGATASISTLTLIKGALKIMAWTKAKTTVVTGAIVVLATISIVTATIYFHHFHFLQSQHLPTGNVEPMIVKSSGYGIILASDGSLWSWGEEPVGWPVLGFANIKNTVSLRRIGNETDWVDVAAAYSHCLAIKSDGTLWAWGGNFSYQLGDGTKISRPTPVSSVPGTDWKQVEVAGGISYALKNDGTLWSWGNDWAGGNRINTNAVQVETSVNWTKIWAGEGQTVGLKSDGSLWFWGFLQKYFEDRTWLTVPTRISPDTNWTDVCFGYFTVFAIKSDGTLWTWGLDANYYSGAETNLNTTPMQIGTDTDWQSCASSSAGFYQMLRKKDGSLWAMDASDHRTIKPDGNYKPVTFRKIDLPKDIVAYVSGGDDIGVVLARDGEVWTWGKVIGEHTPNAFWGPNNTPFDPKYKVIDKPWQLSIIDAPK